MTLPATWDAAPVMPTLTPRAWLADDTEPQFPTSVSLRLSMLDGHPLGGGDCYSTAEATWPIPRTATRRAASPLNGGVAGPGTPITVEMSSSQGQAWTVLRDGRIDRVSGDVSSPGHGCSIVDPIDELAARPARMDALTDVTPGGVVINLCGEWVVDRLLRDAGYYATIPRTPYTLAAATMMGSLWPDGTAGRLVTAAPVGSGTGVASTAQGVAVTGRTVEYAMTSGTSAPLLTFDLPPLTGSQTVGIELLDAAGDGVWVSRFASSGAITWGYVRSGSYSNAGWAAEGNATRAAVKVVVSGSQISAHLHLTGGIVHNGTPQSATSWGTWQATRVLQSSAGALSAFLVQGGAAATRAALDSPPNARIRVPGDKVQRWRGAPALSGDATILQVLTEHARATLSSLWRDPATGVMEWASAGALEAQAPELVKSTRDLVDGLSWSASMESWARSIVVNYRTASTRRSTADRSLLMGPDWSSVDMEPGEVVEQIYEMPDDMDVLGVDTTFQFVDNSTLHSDIKKGSTAGGALVRSDDTDAPEQPAYPLTSLTKINPRTWLMTVTAPTPPAGWSFAPRVADGLAGLASSGGRWYYGRPLPRVAVEAIVRWKDQRETRSGVPHEGLPEVVHDAGHYVQNSERVAELADRLRDEVYGAQTVDYSVEMDYDPRLKPGIVVTVRDEDRQDVEADVLIREVDAAVPGQQARVTGRIVATRNIDPPVVPEPPTGTGATGGDRLPPQALPAELEHLLVLGSLLHNPPSSGGLLVGATETDANLDDPTNQATIARIVSRYSTVVMQDVWWTPVPSQVAAAIRAEATRTGRDVTLLRYVDTCFARGADTAGTMGLVPLSEALADETWLLHNPDGSLKRGGANGDLYFYNHGSTAMRARAVTHLTSLLGDRTVWDGIFLDDVVYTVDGLQSVMGQNNPELPWTTDRSGLFPPGSSTPYTSESTLYEAAITATVQQATDALHAAGALSMINMSVDLVSGRDFAWDVAAACPRAVPYQEILASSWEGHKILRPPDGSSGDDYYYWWDVHLPIRSRVQRWEQQGRRYVVNGHGTTRDVIGYALTAFLQWWGGSGAWCGWGDEGTGYNQEPLWLPEYDEVPALGMPQAVAVEDPQSGAWTRRFPNGRVLTWSPTPGTWTWT